jgi:hypothetical protein
MSNLPVGNSEQSFEISKIPDDLQKSYENAETSYKVSGIGGDNVPELNPLYNQYGYEVLYTGKHDSTIVLGRDRAGYMGSHAGYGISGHTSCAAVDIVVGRQSSAENIDFKNQYLNPDFGTDAARVYLSQKANIDDYLNLPKGKGDISIARSAVALKADGVRIVARENLKLVVGTEQKNSQGGNIVTTNGVDLIAGNLEDGNRIMNVADSAELQTLEISEGGMQPIPLGINTVFALDQIVEKIDKLSAIVSSAGMTLITFINATGPHTHINFVNEFYGIPVSPSIEFQSSAASAAVELIQYTIADVKLLRSELITFKEMHLKPYGAYYINSKYHSLN